MNLQLARKGLQVHLLIIAVNWKRKEKTEEAGEGCPSSESYAGPMAPSSERRAVKPGRSRLLGQGRGVWKCCETAVNTAVGLCPNAPWLPPSLLPLPSLLSSLLRILRGQQAGLQTCKSLREWRDSRCPVRPRRRPQGGPASGPFEEPFFPFETFLCPSEKALGNWLPPVQKARVRLGLLTPKYRAGKRWLNPWLAWQQLRDSTSSWKRGGLLNTGGVEPCVHGGGPHTEARLDAPSRTSLC